MDISYHFMLDAPKGDSGDTRMDQVDHGDVSLCDNSPNRQFSDQKWGALLTKQVFGAHP